MTDGSPFLSEAEAGLAEAFLKDGYVILPAEDRDALTRIREVVAAAAAQHLGERPPADPDGFLNGIHAHVDATQLNALRLAVIGELRAANWFRPAYFSLARNAISAICGNELAMQRGIGFSVQLPDDASSLLPLHTDVWDGDSPFEVVLWVPLVDCRRSKSMFIVPLGKDRGIQARLAEHQSAGVEAFFAEVEDEVTFLDIPFGSVLLFSQTLMHGNRVNREAETRWSMNCRFKSLLSPYADKKLGEFFEPITLRAATRLGSGYRMPEGFGE